MEIHNRKQRLSKKKADAIASAEQLMKRVEHGSLDPWEGYLQICGIFQRYAHLQLPELRSFVRIEGIDPNSSVSVTPELREAIVRRARAFLSAKERLLSENPVITLYLE